MFFCFVFFGIIDIDGPVDMKLIFGTTAVEEKDSQGKEDKVCNLSDYSLFSFSHIKNLILDD